MDANENLQVQEVQAIEAIFGVDIYASSSHCVLLKLLVFDRTISRLSLLHGLHSLSSS